MEIKVAWLYPDVLNLHGDRGNMMALAKIAESMDVALNIKKVNSINELPDLAEIDLIFMGAGQLRDLPIVLEDLKTRENDLKLYVEEGGYLLATGSTGCILGKGYTLVDKTKYKGVGIFDMVARELHRNKMPMVTKEVYGDDILWKTYDGVELVGCQIQRVDYILRGKQKPWGKVIYGYGNNTTDFNEGATYKHAHFTNTVGPFLSCNPWYGVRMIQTIVRRHGGTVKEPQNLEYMTYAKESLELKKQFIKDKTKLSGIQYDAEMMQ